MKDPVQLAQMARAAAQRMDWASAQHLMLEALQLAPDAPALHLNYGNILKQLGRYDEARVAYEQALYWQPNWADAQYNLGNLALVQHDFIAATEHYRATLDANPKHIEAHYNLATLLTNLGQFAPAHQHFAAALALNPQHTDALHNLGRLYRRENRHDLARRYYQLALASNPEHALSQYSLGTLDLYEGNWLSGWAGYEKRWAALHKPYPQTALPRWSGEAVSGNAKLLVIAEQGFGDILQFSRFFPSLLQHFSEVSVLIPAALLRLFTDSFDKKIQFITELDHHAGFSHHIPMMSVAFALNITEQTLSGQAYLRANSAAVQAWCDQLPKGFKVGLAWQGNPQQVDNRWRSIPSHCLTPLLAIDQVIWCNLQYRIAAPAQLRDDSTQWQDFADAAAYIQNLDLVISACTATVHLAGALGVPTILLCRHDADWRWQGERSDSPWYASIRILRQHALLDWATPISAAVQAVKARI
ncbi:tetratricopeptide repeat protein [Chitinibacter sp. SCUT-21]|uniref:tetratricopeptide repeat protein n=1 Tax=Chitinibacter sp. SCUT-21 TaxID=2970891 RepID=UPI0035A6009D